MSQQPPRKPRWDEQPLVPIENRTTSDAFLGEGLFGLMRRAKKGRQWAAPPPPPTLPPEPPPLT
jgi:hypothetical protein